MKREKNIMVESPDEIIVVDHLGHDVVVKLDFGTEGELFVEVIGSDNSGNPILLSQIVKLDEVEETTYCESCDEELTEDNQDREFEELCCVCAREKREK
jgi:hypothetical protein